MVVNVFLAHNFKTKATIDCFPHSIYENQFSFVFSRWDVVKIWIQTVFIGKNIILINTASLNGLKIIIPVCEVNQTFVTYLELALQLPFVSIRDQVRLSQRRVWFQPKLCCVHQCPEEGHLRTLCKLWCGVQCG